MRYRGGVCARLTMGFLCVVGACIEPYTPKNISESTNLITIDGNLNTVDHLAVVKISHPSILNSDDPLKPESGASVTIQSREGNIFTLSETSPGVYSSDQVTIPTGSYCQLRVTTSDGGSYQSPMVEMKGTPPIDSVYFNFLRDGTEILVDTHDPDAQSIYYQWLFEETWEYTAAYQSFFKLVYIPVLGRNAAVPRSTSEFVYRCYKTVPSTRITIGTTEQLDVDRVSRKRLVLIPVSDQKLSVRYSILVKQRAITREEYTYLQQLQRTTESVGGLFDAQPSQVFGNIETIGNTRGTAIGYFSGGATHQQRVYLGFYDLPSQLLIPTPKGTCMLDTVCSLPARYAAIKCSVDLDNLSPSEYIIAEVPQIGLTPTGFTKTTSDCADCRQQGGTLERPSFW